MIGELVAQREALRDPKRCCSSTIARPSRAKCTRAGSPRASRPPAPPRPRPPAPASRCASCPAAAGEPGDGHVERRQPVWRACESAARRAVRSAPSARTASRRRSRAPLASAATTVLPEPTSPAAAGASANAREVGVDLVADASAPPSARTGSAARKGARATRHAVPRRFISAGATRARRRAGLAMLRQQLLVPRRCQAS